MVKESNSDRIRELCSLVAVEQDRERLLKLIEELGRLLEAKDQPMKDQPEKDQPIKNQ